MKERKQPQRTCVGCREEKDKKELIRIVHTPAGRGAYLCRSAECLEKAFRTEALSRSFRTHVPKEAQEKLRAEVKALVGE